MNVWPVSFVNVLILAVAVLLNISVLDMIMRCMSIWFVIRLRKINNAM